MMKSGVIGISPTVPRTPSVPKYLRVMLLSFATRGLPHRDDVPRLSYVMHAKYSRAALQGEERHGEAAGQPLGDRPPGQLAERRLARQPGEERDAHIAKSVEMGEQGQIVLSRLAEAESGIDHQPLARDARTFCSAQAGRQEFFDLAHHVIVVRLALH